MSSRALSAHSRASCPTEATLAAHAEQRLSSGGHAALERHLEACEECDLALAILRASRPMSQVEESTVSLERFVRRTRLARELVPGADLGRFRLLHRLGTGAMGAVFAAYDPELDRRVALKVLLDDGVRDDACAGRLVVEARSMAKVMPPHAVAAYQIGVASGRVFLAMELVEGTTLKEWLAARPPQAEVVHLFQLVAYAVDAAHRAGIVHRDLKPQNILVTKDGQPKVTDFGLASASAAIHADDVERLEASLDARGLVGTPAYMAPEALAGGRAGPAADQYSLAVCLHEALSNRRPHTATTLDELRAMVLREEPALAPVIPACFRAVLARGLAREPSQRFPTTAAFGEALGQAATKRRVARARR